MSRAHLALIATLAALLPLPVNSQPTVLGVCEALNSARDHQAVVIHGAISATRHEAFLFEGTALDPCPGWPKYFFTAPSAIQVLLGSYAGVHVSHELFRANADSVVNLTSDSSVSHTVTVGGVIVRPRWPLIFRNAKGEYCCWGEGTGGRYAAVLVLTSPLIEDH